MACLSIALMPNMACSDFEQNDSSTESTNSLTKIKSKQQAESVASRNAGNIDVQYVYDSSMALVQEFKIMKLFRIALETQ